MQDLPKDPVMLLSVVNTQLRDNYSNIEDLALEHNVSSEDIISRLRTIDYEYNEELNQFK